MTHNPFNPNSVVKPSLFAGRAHQVLQVVRKLAQVRDKMPSNFVFHGERGIGKTALAKLTMFIAQEKSPDFENLNFLVTYYTVEKDQSFQSVLQSSLNLLTDQLPKSSIDRLSTHLGDFFKSGKFSFGAFGMEVGVNKQSGESNEGDLFLKDQAVSILTNILKGLDEEQKKDNKAADGILIVIDEIHNVKEIEGIAQIFRSITTTLDMNGHGNVSFLILGYTSEISKFFNGDPSAKRSFDSFPLETMPDDEAADILFKGFKQAGINYKKDLIQDKIGETGGYPHSIQVLGHKLVDFDTDNSIDEVDWKEAIGATAIELQLKDFSTMYNFEGRIRLREEVLNVLALMPGSVQKSDLAKEFDKKGNNIYTRSCLPELKKSGAIKEDAESGLLSLQSTLFKSAIRLHVFSRLGDAVEKKRHSKKQGWIQILSNLSRKENVVTIGH